MKTMAKQTPQVNNMFLIGAGFTKAVFPNAPLNPDLLSSVIDDNPKSLLKKYQIRYRTDDIEILLTYMDLETVELQSERLKQDRQGINKEIAEYFQRFRAGLPKNKKGLKNMCWLKQLANGVFTDHDVIVNLNYDCFLEGLLDYHKVWCPSTGYGAVEVDVPGTSLQNLLNPKNILTYKIHGSENFQTCSVDLKDVNPKRISLVVNEEIYPQSGKNRHLGVVQGKAYIIAPSFVKTFYPQIQLMMIGALQAAAMAKNFVIIGCGLRPEDSFLWLLLAAFLYRPANGELIIVDPCAKGIKDKICEHYHDTNKLISPICRNLECSVDELIEKLHNTCS